MKKTTLKSKIKAFFGFYGQRELIELKEFITQRIEKIKTGFEYLITTSENTDLLEQVNLLELCRIDLAKVKQRISVNNSIFLLNGLIYRRERSHKLSGDLISLQNNELLSTGTRVVLKQTLRLTSRIARLKKEIKEIDIKRNNRNKLAITLFLYLKTV